MAAAAAAAREQENRRLRPIWEHIDSQNYKQAIKACDVLLKKHTSHGVKVLKALALARSQRQDEAIRLCQEIQAEKPTEERTLNWLYSVYKTCGRGAEMIASFETALKEEPNNVSLMTLNFYGFIRTNRYKEAQMLALGRLAKATGEARYTFWAIGCSYLMLSSITAPLTPDDEKTLQFAELLFARATLTTYEELLLRLLILERKNKLAESLTLITEQSALFKVATDRDRITGDLHTRLAQWAPAAEVYRRLVSENPDHWEYHMRLQDAVFHLATAEGGALRTNKHVTEAAAFVASLETSEDGKTTRRGPCLALIEMEKRLLQAGESQAELRGKIIEYFTLFGSKIVCFTDLRPYVSLFTGNGTELIAALRATLPTAGADAPREAQLDSLSRQVRLEALARSVGAYAGLSRDEKIAKANALIAQHEAALGMAGTLERGEREPADDLLHMAVHLLQEVLQAEPDNRTLTLEIIGLLQYGLEKSKFNFQFMLLLLEYYVSLGAFSLVREFIIRLELKHIQWDTLSHKFIPQMTYLGYQEQAQETCRAVLDFYENNENETPDYIAFTFRDNTFSKTREFLDFKNKLASSTQRVIVETEELLLRTTSLLGGVMDTKILLLDTPLRGDTDAFYAALTDTRDHDSRANWDSREQLEQTRTQRQAKETAVLAETKLKRSLLALLNALLSGDIEASELALVRYQERLTQLRPLLVASKQCGSVELQESSWRLVSELATATIPVLRYSATEDVATKDSLGAPISGAMNAVNTLLTDIVRLTDLETIKTGDAYEFIGSATRVDRLANLFLSVCVLVINVWAEKIPKKKKPKDQAYTPIREAMRQLRTTVLDTFAAVQQMVTVVHERDAAAVGSLLPAGHVPVVSVLTKHEALFAQFATEVRRASSNASDIIREKISDRVAAFRDVSI